jgi:polysaccharide pyruvyl transferase WcaK-like protein
LEFPNSHKWQQTMRGKNNAILRAGRVLDKSLKHAEKALLDRRPNLAYISGYLGFGNLGDEAMYLSAQLLFKRLAILHYDNSRTLKFLHQIFPLYKAGMLAGGTLINAQPGYYEAAEEFVRRCGNFYIFGSGVVQPAFWSRRNGYVDMMDKWKPLLERCSYVGVRGPLSAEILSEAGIQGVEVIGDPALVFAGESPGQAHTPDSIGLNVGDLFGDVWGDEKSIAAELVKLARRAREAGWLVKWFVLRPGDVEITRRAAVESNTAGHVIETYHDPFRFLQEVGSLSVFVGMKLHAIILATCAYVPSISIQYQEKCLDYMRSISQEAAGIRSDQFKGEEVWEIVQRFAIERETRSAFLYKQIRRLTERQKAKADEITNQIVKL